MERVNELVRTHRRLVIGLFIALDVMLLLIVGLYVMVGAYGKYVLPADDAASKDIRVGIVFGAGVAPNGQPYDELAGRLDGAAELYHQGVIEKLLVSGDNRTPAYNEPQAMQNYLTEQRQVPLAAIQQDNAGRSTYETCERAKKVFGLDRALLITAPSHQPRALFICRKFGVESYGAAYGEDANNAFRREFLARIKAVINVYVWREQSVLGDPIKL